MQLYELLDSVKSNITGLDRIYVVIRCDNEDYYRAYRNVAAVFDDVLFVQHYSKDDFKQALLACFT